MKTERVLFAGIPRENALRHVKNLQREYDHKLQVPKTEEELKRCEVRGNSKTMDIVLRGENLGARSFELLEVEAHDGAKIKLRAQKLPFEWKESTEVMTMSSTRIFLMCDFIEDMSARLTEEIEGMTCEDIFLKAGTVALRGENTEDSSESGTSTRSTSRAKILPVVRVLVREKFRAKFEEKWRNWPAGGWISSSRGFQAQVWRRGHKIKKQEMQDKMPVTLPALFVHGVQQEMTVGELHQELKTWMQQQFQCVKMKTAGLWMIILAPGETMSDQQLRRAEAVMSAALADPERRLRVNYSPAPTHTVPTTPMPPSCDVSTMRNEPDETKKVEELQARIRHLEKELRNERKIHDEIRTAMQEMTKEIDDGRRLRDLMKARIRELETKIDKMTTTWKAAFSTKPRRNEK